MADDIYLPWPVGGIRRNERGQIMVEIEADLLVVMAARAKVETERLMVEHMAAEKPPVGQRGYDHQSRRHDLNRDINNFGGLSHWLGRLSPRRLSW